MTTSLLQGSFVGGEISPSLYGRTDLARYQNSLKTCRNFIVSPYGGVKNRAGLRFVSEVQDSTKSTRLIPFEFSTVQTYIIELGDYTMRIIKDGAMLLNTESISSVGVWSGATTYAKGDYVKYTGGTTRYYSKVDSNLNHDPATSSTYWLEIPQEADGTTILVFPTPWSHTQIADVNYTQSADVLTVVHPDVQPYQINRYSEQFWSLDAFEYENGPFQTLNTVTSKTVYLVDDLGSTTLYSSAKIFESDHVGMMFYVEQTMRAEPWVAEETGVSGQRYYNGNTYIRLNGGTTAGTVPPTHTSGVASDGALTWLYMHSGFGICKITAVDPGGYSASVDVIKRMPISVCSGVSTQLTIASITEDSGNLKITTSTAHGIIAGNFVMFSITASGITYNGTAEVTSAPDTDELVLDYSYIFDNGTFESGYALKVDTSYRQPTHVWGFGAWGGDQGWPSVVGYHQQRLVFANTAPHPQTLWMSKTASFPDFGADISIKDNDAVTFTIASSQVNAINGLLSLDNLVVLTNGGIWIVGSGDQDVITPSNIALKKQGYNGSYGVTPIGIGNSGLYIQSSRSAVRDLAYELASDGYNGNDLSVPASHLLQGYSILDWAYQANPFYCVWMVRDDGVLLGLTYMREQQVAGWHRHDTDGIVESVACVPETDEDGLYLVVKRTIGGVAKRYIERMDTRTIDDLRDLFMVDSGLTYDGRNTTATTITVSGGTLWDHTEDLTLTASSGIFAYPATTDVGDSIVIEDSGIFYRLTIASTSSSTVATARLNRTLPADYRGVATTEWYFARDTLSGLDHLEGETVVIQADGQLATSQVVTSGAVALDPPAFIAHVGLPYTCDCATLDVNITGSETLMDKKKAINSVKVLVEETNSLKVGRDYDHLAEVKFRKSEFYDSPTNLVTGLVEAKIATNWGTNGGLAIRVSDPLPVSILAIIPEVTIAGA